MNRNCRVLFITPPASHPTLRDYYCSSSTKGSYVWQPIDFVVQSGFLKGTCLVEVIDGTLTGHLSEESILSKAAAFSPETVFALTGAANYPGDFDFLRKLHDRVDAAIVVSGDIAQFQPEQLLRDYPWISGVLRDFTSPALKKFIENRDAGDLSFWQAGDDPDLPFLGGTFRYPVPDHAAFSAMGYRQPFLRRPFASLLTNYGCPYHCVYCNSGALGFRLREFSNLKEELDALRETGIRELFIKDMTFNAILDHTNQVLDEFIEENMGFRFICYARPDVLDETLARKMKRAGCRLVMLGIETGDDAFLKSLKGQSVAQVIDACDAMDRVGLSYGGHFLVGFPGEDDERFEKTLSLARRIRARYASINILTPRFGSDLRADLVSAGKGPGSISMDGSKTDTNKEVESMRRRAIFGFYSRPSYLARMLFTPRHWLDLPGFFSNAMAILRQTFNWGDL